MICIYIYIQYASTIHSAANALHGARPRPAVVRHLSYLHGSRCSVTSICSAVQHVRPDKQFLAALCDLQKSAVKEASSLSSKHGLGK